MACNSQSDSIERVRVIDVETVTKTVEVGDRTFPVVDEGDGPVVFLIHGFPDSRRLWRYQVPALTDAGFRVVAPDMRGFGDAPRPEGVESYALPRIIEEDVVGIMDALDVQNARVVGHDWGGQVAWLTTSTYPERVEQLVSITAGAPNNAEYFSAEQMQALWHIYFFQFESAEQWIRHDDWRFFREWCMGGDDVEKYIENLSRPGALTAGLNWYRANISQRPPSEIMYDYPAVTCPVLGVIAGDGPYLKEPQMRNSTEKIDLNEGSWRYEVVDGAGHWVPTDAPAELNELLVDFLEK